jgi:hypothetical protein
MTTKIAFSTMALKGKIADGDGLWPDFTRSFRNLEMETIDIANESYMGHPLTTWHKNNWRHSSNYQLGQHIGLDFDTEDQHSTLAHLAKDKFIAKYASLIYTTPSHLPEAPRARVLFFLDSPIHQPKNYINAATALLWLFGNADAKCKDPCRFFYGSVNCDMEYLDNVLPVERLKEIILQWQTTGSNAKRQAERGAIEGGDANKTVDSVIAKATNGERNNLGFWLACALAEKGMNRTEVEQHMRRYQQAVQTLGSTIYSEQEAIASVASAFRKVA